MEIIKEYMQFVNKNRHKEILKFIETIRHSFIGTEDVYMHGSCYHFYTILKAVFKDVVPYYNQDHVISKIDGRYYDILGEVVNDVDRYEIYYTETELGSGTKMPFNIYKDTKK